MRLKILAILMLFLLVAIPTASAWSINPAKWTFYNRDDYELKPITFEIEIKNSDPAPITIELSLMDPEYLYDGSEPLPDFSWIDISQSSVTVQGNSQVEVPVYINIPEDYETSSGAVISNYNKTYEAWIFADMTEGGGNIQVDYRCRWVFKTPLRYVPPSERAGHVDFTFYLMLIGITAVVIIVVVLIYKKMPLRGKKVETKSRRKSKPRDTSSDDDVFS